MIVACTAYILPFSAEISNVDLSTFKLCATASSNSAFVSCFLRRSLLRNSVAPTAIARMILRCVSTSTDTSTVSGDAPF